MRELEIVPGHGGARTPSTPCTRPPGAGTGLARSELSRIPLSVNPSPPTTAGAPTKISMVCGGTMRCMGKVYPGIDDSLTSWLSRQRMFFVGTAPLSGDGSVNVSPKGMAGTFAVLGPRRVAYLDYTGSGAETIAHLRENGRIVLMFCAFDGPPKIVRLHGNGRVVPAGDPEFDELRPAFGKDRALGQRSVIVVDVTRISDSCGYAVPLMDFRSDRDILDRSQERRDEDYFRDYWRRRNATSIDGLRAMDAPAAST